MIHRQAYKFEIRPSADQARKLRGFAGACRYVFNRALILQKERELHGEPDLGYARLCNLLTQWRNSPDTAWLADAPVHPLQQKLRDLSRAYSDFRACHKGRPRLKKKGRDDGFRYPDPAQIRLEQYNCRLMLPKLGWIRYRKSREVIGEVRNVTVVRSGEKWFASIHTERETAQPTHPSNSIVGIDLGITRFATLSDGTIFAARNILETHRQRLARYQRVLTRKVRFSNNWKKAKARIRKLHQGIGNIRADYLHKTTTTISKNHAVVCIEDLQVQNMSKSAAGTREHPGKNVRNKQTLNRSILNQGWFEFRRQLAYKQAWRGGELLTVPPRNTSRTCPACVYVSADNRPTQALFRCVQCGFEENADLVASINVLRAGHARLACRDTSPVAGASAQEPTESAMYEVSCA